MENVEIYLAPILQSENAYQSTIELEKTGATMLWNITLEAAYVKLSLAYGNFIDAKTIISFMQQNLAGEYV
jgi:L-asparaginase